MRKLLLLFPIVFAFALAAPAQTPTLGALNGFCTPGAVNAATQGALSTNTLIGAVPSCTVTVYNTGTTTLATLYANSISSPLSNPFFASQKAQWIFHAPTNSCYDIVLSGGYPPNTFATPLTLTDVCVPSTLSNVNGIINAALLMTGNDITTGIRAALAILNGACGTIAIPLGEYNWLSQVTFPNCVTLEGNGAIVNVPSLSTPALVIAGLPVYIPISPQLYTPGQIKNITFAGPGASDTSTIGIFYGGDGNGVFTPNTYRAFLTKFDNLHITGFGHGFQLGIGFQAIWIGGVIEANNIGVDSQNNITFIENLSFVGTEIINNIQQGIFFNNTGLQVELNLTDSSEDYNGQTYSPGRQITFVNGILNLNGGHLEGPTIPFIDIVTPSAPTAVNLSVNGVGMALIDTNPAHTYPGYITDEGLNTNIFIGKGVTFTTLAASATAPGASIVAAVDFTTVPGGNVGFYAEPYEFLDNYQHTLTLPAFAGTVPGQGVYPVYNPTGGSLMSMTSLVQGVFNGVSSLSGDIGIGAKAAPATPIDALDFYTSGNSTPDLRIQVDSQNVSLQNYTGTINKNLIAANVTTQGVKPLFGTVAPTGSCTPIGMFQLTADGAFTYCNPITATWKTLYSTAQALPVQSLSTSFTTSSATTDTITLSGMTSSGHCTLQPTNASAATNYTTTYISAKGSNTFTVTHAATAGMTFDAICTPY